MKGHKHKKKILEYAQDCQEDAEAWQKWEFIWNDVWVACKEHPAWNTGTEIYRRIDPYRELKEAQERGEVIQFRYLTGDWNIATTPTWNLPVDRYRIKPKVKKLYAFLVCASAINTTGYMKIYFKCESGAQSYCDTLAIELIKQLDDEPIEMPE